MTEILVMGGVVVLLGLLVTVYVTLSDRRAHKRHAG